MLPEERTCKNELCRRRFIPTDPRQRYHSRQCQRDWNNYKARLIRDQIRPVLQKLRQNREILQRILKKGLKTVSRDYLLGAGYDFLTFTRALRDQQTGRLCHFVFEYALTNNDDGTFTIIRSDAGLCPR